MLGWWETFWLGLAIGLGFRLAAVVIHGMRMLWEGRRGALRLLRHAVGVVARLLARTHDVHAKRRAV
jgi:hypothetical protein